MKKLVSLITALSVTVATIVTPIHAYAQFVPGQVLGAAQLNAAIASPTITGGSINGAVIGGTNPQAVTTTALGVKGATSGVVSILPQSAAGTYNFNLPTTAGASGSVLTSAAGGSSPMTWTPQSSLAVGSATTATNASTTAVSNNASYYPMMGTAASSTDQTFNVSSGLSFNPTVGLDVVGGITTSGTVTHNVSAVDANLKLGTQGALPGVWSINDAGSVYKDLRIDGSVVRINSFSAGSTAITGSLAVSGALDLASAVINTYNSGASKWGYFQGGSNIIFTGTTGFYVNDQANTKNIFTVLDAAPNNAMVVGPTGTSVVGTLSSSGALSSGTSLGGVAINPNTTIFSEKTAENYLTLKTSNTGVAAVLFADTDDNDVGNVGYNHATNTLSLVANNTSVAQVTPSGVAVTGDVSTSTSFYANGGNNTLALRTSGVTTGYTAIQLTNTGGNAIFGQENSVGSNLIIGASAYDSIVRGPSGLAFSANNGASMQARLSSTALTLGTGVNLVPASGNGVDFSAVANGTGTTTSEVLSAYSEGTFTPTVTYETPGTLSVSYSTQSGYYTRTGRSVSVQILLRISAFTKGTASGQLRLAGLPFTAASGDVNAGLCSIGTYNAPFTTIPVGNVVPGGTTINLLQLNSNSAWTALDDPDADSQYTASCTYRM